MFSFLKYGFTYIKGRLTDVRKRWNKNEKFLFIVICASLFVVLFWRLSSFSVLLSWITNYKIIFSCFTNLHVIFVIALFAHSFFKQPVHILYSLLLKHNLFVLFLATIKYKAFETWFVSHILIFGYSKLCISVF